MELYLIRHTTPEVAPGVCYGRLDVPLAGSFPDEAEAIRQRLKVLPAMDFFSSPAQRCRRLAEQLDPSALHFDARLQEMDFGAWEGCAWTDIDRAQSDIWAVDFIHTPCPGGESWSALRKRVMDFLEHLVLRKLPRAAIVTHAGVIRTIVAHYRGLPPEKLFEVTVGYGEIIHIADTGGAACG
ncbi:MAG: alpha-ribazole phosphatase [Nitrosomonadales bacterium]|nr:MAG: alpha-ribazole phosphatase [Nitrosomonadales bacterium]